MSTLYNAAYSLAEMPFRGRAGIVAGTREILVAPLPYWIVYRARHEVVEILYIHHTARLRLS
jgi:plasmid stabilization system protein ParE